MKNIKEKIIGILLIILGFSLVVLPYHFSFASEDKKTYQDPRYPFFMVKASYHFEMNRYFDSKLLILKEVLDNPEFYKDERFLSPDGVDIDNFEEKCGEDNVSTFCVAMGALSMFSEFVDTLSEMKDKIISREEVDHDTLGMHKVYQLSTSRNHQISQELSHSENVLMATVSAYNEYRIAYPIHKKNQEIIKTLVKYRRALINVRRLVEMFPSKFVDATSPYCK